VGSGHEQHWIAHPVSVPVSCTFRHRSGGGCHAAGTSSQLECLLLAGEGRVPLDIELGSMLLQ